MSLLSPPLPPTSFSIVDPSWVLCACHQRNEPQTIQVSVKLARPTVGYAENNCLVSKVNEGFYSQIEDYKPTEINWGLGLAKKKPHPPSPAVRRRNVRHILTLGKHIPNFTGFAYGTEKFQWRKKQELTFLIDYHDRWWFHWHSWWFHRWCSIKTIQNLRISMGFAILRVLGMDPLDTPMVNKWWIHLNLPGVSSWNPKKILKAFMLGWWLWPTHLGLDSIMVLILWTLLLIILLATSDIYTWTYYLIVLECKRRSYINEIWSW